MDETTPSNPTDIDLGHMAGLTLTASNSALIGSGILWLAIVAVMLIFFRVSVVEAAVLGIFGILLHWISELAHQLGHARAARKAGYPMIAVRFWGVLSSSIYPADEPTLPASVHISRALGGPITSGIIGLIAAIFLLILPFAEVPWWIVLFFAADNLLVFSLGALLPLGFTDGSTILRNLRKPS